MTEPMRGQAGCSSVIQATQIQVTTTHTMTDRTIRASMEVAMTEAGMVAIAAAVMVAVDTDF